MKSSALVSLSILATALFAGACSPGVDSSTGTIGSGGSGSGSGGSTSSAGGSGQNATSSAGQFMDNVASTGSSGPCASGPNDDADMDGFTVAEGDCNDCDANVNPGAIEVMTADGTGGGGGAVPADEDCDGTVDNVPMPCDSGIAVDTSNAMDGARAIELCHQPTGPKDWGVLSAKWVRANGADAGSQEPAQHGVLANLGPNVGVRAGSNMLALSSGRARAPGQTGACGAQTCSSLAGTPPPGFPQGVPNCAGGTTINDDMGLEVQIRAPKNATGYKFDFKFYSFEFAEWVCTTYNDQFIALVSPPPMGSINGNLSFDSVPNPISVNAASFFYYCDTCSDWAADCFSGTCPPVPNPCCAGGTAETMGTGFDVDAGGTAWLQTQAPIDPSGEITIRFAIWDTGDHSLDSTALVDNFQWIANGGTVSVGTTPVPQ